MSELVRREQCPFCRAMGRDKHGDNKAVYSDGSGYCFACEQYFPPPEEEQYKQKRRQETMPDILRYCEYRPLTKRNLLIPTLQKFGYTTSTYKGTPVQVAPYYNQAGELFAQHIRFPDKAFMWLGDSRDVQLFGQHLWNTGSRRLTIAEGEIDAMSISQLQDNKWPVVSIPSGVNAAKKALINNLEFVNSFDEVVICFDNDEPGRTAARQCAEVLEPGKARIAQLPLKDANEMLVKGRGKEVVPCLWQAQIFRPDGVVSACELKQSLFEEPSQGYDLPYPALTDKLQGVRKGELVLFTAGSGIGKSTAVHEIGKHLVDKHKQRIGIMALEESKRRTLERYVGMELNKPLHTPKGRELTTNEEIETAFEKSVDGDNLWFYDHFGSTQVENLLNKIRYMIKALEINFLILDHISIVVSGLSGDEGERKTIDILMTALRSLIEETGIGVLAVVHLKRPEKGKSWNEGRQVSLTDLRGSASLEQLSDVVVALERNQQDESKKNYSQIRVLKSRLIGDIGLCDTLEYSHETGRLLAVDQSVVADGQVFAEKVEKEDF